LYSDGVYDGSELYCSLFCIGNTVSDLLAKQYPAVPQRTWTDVAEFLFTRFAVYHQRKTDHSYWDEVGQRLWRIFEGSRRELQSFEDQLRGLFSLPPA
jgi:hypothetical protein